MELHRVWADRGQWLEIGCEEGNDERPNLLAISCSGGMALREPQSSFWVAIRGEAEIEAREGHFVLRRGDWLSLDREAGPTVTASRNGLVVGLSLPWMQQERIESQHAPGILIGRGTMDRRALRHALKMWSGHRAGAVRGIPDAVTIDPLQLKAFVRHLSDQQRELAALIERAPGRSRRRRLQVFCRMQRAYLYLEGHVERAVRLVELAEISSFSVWYFTKIFHAMYGNGPQEVSASLRLRNASRLLERSRLSVGEVAEACGFENICSFSRAFSRRYGVAPSIFRRRKLAPDCVNRDDISGKAFAAFGT